jgi:hypothetical protein
LYEQHCETLANINFFTLLSFFFAAREKEIQVPSYQTRSIQTPSLRNTPRPFLSSLVSSLGSSGAGTRRSDTLNGDWKNSKKFPEDGASPIAHLGRPRGVAWSPIALKIASRDKGRRPLHATQKNSKEVHPEVQKNSKSLSPPRIERGTSRSLTLGVNQLGFTDSPD